MSLIKARPNRVRTIRHICRLKEPNRDTLVLYARFIGDTADYVLNQLIETTLAKDREFVELYFGEGLDPDEVARRMGISVKTVYSKRHKIQRRLQSLFGQQLAA